MTRRATPSKLRDGRWGARVEGGPVDVGTLVEIVTRAGKRWGATVSSIVWTDGAVSLVVTDSSDAPAPRRHTRGRRSTYAYFPSSGVTLYQNENGRCEDAPCCGCCS